MSSNDFTSIESPSSECTPPDGCDEGGRRTNEPSIAVVEGEGQPTGEKCIEETKEVEPSSSQQYICDSSQDNVIPEATTSSVLPGTSQPNQNETDLIPTKKQEEKKQLVDLEIGSWEKHTRGIGAKLLLQMGYQAGKGLGKDLQGISAPVEATLKKGRAAIGYEENNQITKTTGQVYLKTLDGYEKVNIEQNVNNIKEHVPNTYNNTLQTVDDEDDNTKMEIIIDTVGSVFMEPPPKKKKKKKNWQPEVPRYKNGELQFRKSQNKRYFLKIPRLDI